MNLNFPVSDTFLCLHALVIWVEVEEKKKMHSYYALIYVCVGSCMCRMQAVGVGTVLIWDFGVAYTRGGGVHTFLEERGSNRLLLLKKR